jgi:pimeloyl-ACP methyl ester carboxylesterase
MTDGRTHSVTTSDGVAIGGPVHGEGPPLVFVQGVIGDGDLDWQALVPHLSDRFTCYLPSLRGRGQSGDHADVGFGRLVDDVLTYVDGIGAPAGVVGWSLGAGLALAAAAAQPDAVAAVAAVGPGMPGVMDEHERAALGAAIASMGELAAEGRSTDAARAFARFLFTDEEIAVADGAGYFEAAGRYVPNLLSFFQQQLEYDGPAPDDPAVLGAISAPVLALHGSESKQPSDAAGARHLADHVPNARIQQIPDAGHAAPLTHPEALAEALAEFFSRARQAA